MHVKILGSFSNPSSSSAMGLAGWGCWGEIWQQRATARKGRIFDRHGLYALASFGCSYFSKMRKWIMFLII